MKIDRRNFFKVSSGVVASLFIPATLRAKIPIEKAQAAHRAFEWIADSDWGTISYVGVFDDFENLLQMNPVDYPQVVNKSDTVKLSLNIEGHPQNACYIGLFNDSGKEVTGKGYSRIKTWFLELVKGGV